MEPVTAYVLAGGRSSRLGRAKARVVLGGEPLLVWAAREHEQWASSVVVVGETAGQYDDLGLRTIADLRPGCGPLGGLQAALADQAQPGWILLASCDLLGLQTAWIAALCARRDEAARVVAFRGEHWQPLPALYHTDVQAEVAAQLAAGAWSLWRLIERVPALALPLPPDWERVAHLTSAADLERLEAVFSEQALREGPSRGHAQ